MSIMETADRLLELTFKWIRESEACARELQKMADELESLWRKCRGGEKVGRTMKVVGATCLVGAGVATLFTGGAAAPLLALAGAYTGVGATVSTASKFTKHLSSSNIMKEAQKKEEESNNIAKKIERQFEQLKELSPHMDPDDLDQNVMTAFMGAVGRHSGNRRVISLLEDMPFDFGGGRNMMFQDPSSVSWFSVETLGIASVLAFFAFQPHGEKYNFLFDKAKEQLAIMMASTAFETVLKRGVMVEGRAVSLVFTLPEVINSCMDLIKNNHVTEASQSLRDTANGILKMTRKLKEQLDNSRKELERLADVKWCIENTDRSFEDERELIEYAIENCNDKQIKQWLMQMSAQKVFFRLLDMFNFLKDQLNQEKKKKKIDIDDIDITFVAHGAIQEETMLAKCLLPLPSIKDVLLYSPWNCLLRADAAYGIATGRIQPWHREFLSSSNRPSKLPNNWNSMRWSGGDMIPVITVSSLTKDDGAWKRFELLQTKHGEPGRKRVILPFLFPEKVKVPFFIITLALSLVLWFSPIKATVHLAACLGKASSSTRLNVWHLMMQYAYTKDKTVMTTLQVMLEEKSTDLYRALKAMFDKTSAPSS